MIDATASPDIPDLVPARMVNEFSYCPRLFFLEWVQARFADNADTVEGRWRHKRVDQPTGRAPLPDDDGEVHIARSVMLSSTSLGVVAKVDVMEADGDEIVPVDTKKGTPPDNDKRSWEPERIQLCLQGALLTEAGYHCTHGYLWFAEARRRVRIEFDQELIERTGQLLVELREVAASDIPPPPLVDSPKCPRCSLVGLCLPDETNLMAARRDMPPRRLIPSHDAPKPVYVTEPDVRVQKDHQRLDVVRGREKLASVPIIDVSEVCIYGNAQVSTQLLRELFAREIPVCWFSSGGWFSGMGHGLPARNVELRRRQVVVASQGGLAIARRIVAGKVSNSRTLLMRNSRQRPRSGHRPVEACRRPSGRRPNRRDPARDRGRGRTHLLQCVPLDARRVAERCRRAVLLRGSQPASATRSGERTALLPLRAPRQGAHGDDLRCGHGPVSWLLPPAPVRPSGVGPRLGRGVSAADRRVGHGEPHQQR